MMRPPSFVVLSDRSFLKISGPDAPGFLQRLITKDVLALVPGQVVFGGLLSPQGKLLFDFLICLHETDTFICETNAVLVDHLHQRLLSYRVGARVRIECLESWCVGVGFPSLPLGDERNLADLGPSVIFRDPRCEALGHRFWFAKPVLQDKMVDAVSSARYHEHALRLGIGEVGRDFPSGSIFPLHANLDFLGGLDVQKGCFVGQEVVARMRNRSKVKKRLMPVQDERGTRLVEVTIPPWLSALRGCA